MSSCTPTRTYHITETTYQGSSEPVVKESIVVVKKALPTYVYVEEYDRDYIVVERPWCREMLFSHRYHHHPRYDCPRPRPRPRSHAEFHFGFGFRH